MEKTHYGENDVIGIRYTFRYYYFYCYYKDKYGLNFNIKIHDIVLYLHNILLWSVDVKTLIFLNVLDFYYFYLLVSFYLMVHSADLKMNPSLTGFFIPYIIFVFKAKLTDRINVQSRIKLMIKLT